MIQHMFMYINNLRLSKLIIYYSKTIILCNFTHNLCSQNTSNLSSRCKQVSKRRGIRFWNQLCNITAKKNNIVHTIPPRQIQTVYWSGLTIGIGARWENFAHRKIREILLVSTEVGRCTGLSNRCKFWLTNQQAGK